MASLALPIISGIGSIFGGLFGASSASHAAQQQIQAEQQAQQQLQQSEGQAIGFQQNILGQNQSNYAPYLGAGANATGNLNEMLGTPGQGLLTPWTNTFTAPTAAQAAQTPGYQFQLGQGEQAIQNSAAARGGLLSGQTLADMNSFGQGLASTNYQNTFNNALQQYNSAYNTFQNNQNNTYNRLFGLSNQGLSATGQMGNLNQMAAGNFGNITTGTGADIASLYNQQGAAKAAGTIGTGSALSGMFNNLGNTAMQYGLLNQLNPSNWNSSTPSSAPWGGGGSAPWGAAPWMQPGGMDPWMQNPSSALSDMNMVQ
jgi:hypothetical protein